MTTNNPRGARAARDAPAWHLPAAAQDLVISNARILDGTGNEIERGTVVVREGRIAAVGANASGAPPMPCESTPAGAP